MPGVGAAAALCIACGASLPPGAALCDGCGSSTVTATRRVVAVVFADLAGYTQLCEALDPEEVHLLVRPLMNGLRRACLELGGDVPSIEGDGFMAVFGAVRTSEDAPLRALAAAVQMQRLVEERRAAYGPELPRLRVGVNLGEVLVAPSWERGGFSVSGDAVNVGSRLCTAAAPGEVLVASVLLPGVPTSLRWSEETQFTVRHRELPVAARKLVWEDGRALPDSRRLPSSTPFVGREALLTALDEALGTALLVGEPGVGKSRCAREWAARSGRLVLAAGCPSFRAGDESALATELARGLPASWLEDHPPILRRRLRKLAGLAVDTHEADPVDAQLEALVTVLLARAMVEPLLLLVDDLHWATESELSLVGALVGRAGIAVLATCRPDGAPVLASPAIVVPPLDPSASAELVELLLPGASGELAGFLSERAGGVPLFLEQCSQLLLDKGTVELTVDGAVLRQPDQLRQVPTVMRMFVTGRLDLLEPDEREVLALASVSGDVVEPDLLRHLARRDVSEDVESVVTRGLLRWEPGQDGAQLRFRHALVRDVAYEGLLRGRRVEQHRAAADWYSVRLPHGAMAARAAHLEAALMLSEGRGEPDCTLAGETLLALLAHAHGLVQERPTGALEVLRRAESIVDHLGICELDRVDLDLALGEVLEVLGDDDRALASVTAARAAAEAAGDRSGTAQALLLEATLRTHTQPAVADALFAAAQAVYVELDDLVGIAKVEAQRAYADMGEAPSRIPAAYVRAYDAAQRAGDARMASIAAQLVAFHATFHGRPYLDEWCGHAEALLRPDDEAGRCRILVGRTMVDLQALELADALRHGREALRLAQDIGVNHVARNATWAACDAATLQGELVLAEELLVGSQRIAEARPTDHQRFDALVSEAILRSRQGRRTDADRALAALGPMADSIGLAYVREATACRAQVAADSGHFADVPALAQDVMALDAEIEQSFWSLRPGLLRLQCLVLSRRRVSFADGETLRREARERGAPAIAAIAVRWLELDDLLKGERPLIELHLPALPDLADARAVDHALHAFLTGDWSRLLAAADEWQTLGVTAWPAVALFWYAELTGDDSRTAEARELLHLVGAPEDLEPKLRAHVAGR